MMKNDPLLQPLEALIHAALPFLAAFGQYGAEVVGQNADGTLELRVDDARFSTLSSVRILHANNGMQVKVAAKSRVLVAFIGADRRFPVVTHWEPHGLQEMKLTASETLHLSAPNVLLGANATQALIKGNQYRAADTAFDTSISTATTALSVGLQLPGTGPIATLAPIVQPAYVPSLPDIKVIAAQVIAIGQLISTCMLTLSAAAQAKETACATSLSLVSKTE